MTAPLSRPVEYSAELDLGSWLQRLAFVSGSYEADTVEFLVRLAQAHPRPGAILDIGANVGLISVPLAALLQRSCSAEAEVRICAFEPVDDNFDQLKRNVELNALGGTIRLFNVALGDEHKAVDIQVEGDLAPGEGSGTANILPEGSRFECTRIPLNLRTLDEMVLAGEVDSNVSLIKIDTDGYDLKILCGARQLLLRSRPVAFGEFNAHCMQWHGQSVSSVREYAMDVGYEIFAKNRGEFRFSRKVDDKSYSQDLLLVPQEFRSGYAWCLS